MYLAQKWRFPNLAAPWLATQCTACAVVAAAHHFHDLQNAQRCRAKNFNSSVQVLFFCALSNQQSAPLRPGRRTEMPRRRWYRNTSALALSCRDHGRDQFARDVHRCPCSGEEQDVLVKFRPMHRSQQKPSNHTEHCSQLLLNMVLSSHSSGAEYESCAGSCVSWPQRRPSYDGHTGDRDRDHKRTFLRVPIMPCQMPTTEKIMNTLDVPKVRMFEFWLATRVHHAHDAEFDVGRHP